MNARVELPAFEDPTVREAAVGRPLPFTRTVAVRVLNYATNTVISRVPSFRVRKAWYRHVLGVGVGRGTGIHSGCYIWFCGPGHNRRMGTRIGANTRINRDCCLDVRGGLIIGDNVSVSPEVAIITMQHDY